MQVWIVLIGHDYHGETIDSVWSTEEAARKRAADYEKWADATPAASYDWTSVDDWEVDDSTVGQRLHADNTSASSQEGGTDG